MIKAQPMNAITEINAPDGYTVPAWLITDDGKPVMVAVFTGIDWRNPNDFRPLGPDPSGIYRVEGDPMRTTYSTAAQTIEQRQIIHDLHSAGAFFPFQTQNK